MFNFEVIEKLHTHLTENLNDALKQARLQEFASITVGADEMGVSEVTVLCDSQKLNEYTYTYYAEVWANHANNLEMHKVAEVISRVLEQYQSNNARRTEIILMPRGYDGESPQSVYMVELEEYITQC